MPSDISNGESNDERKKQKRNFNDVMKEKAWNNDNENMKMIVMA